MHRLHLWPYIVLILFGAIVVFMTKSGLVLLFGFIVIVFGSYGLIRHLVLDEHVRL